MGTGLGEAERGSAAGKTWVKSMQLWSEAANSL